MKKTAVALIVVVLIFFTVNMYAVPQANSREGGETVYVIPVEDMITAGTASFMRRNISAAESAGANAVLIVMDTPGGLVDATLDLNRVFRGTDIPVIVYVYPSGAIAASAGAFILLSADVAAMSPGTTVGAAQPVAISPGGEVEQAEDKTTNFLAGHIRSIAKESGRPQDIAERFVTENLVLNYDEALEKGISDITATSMQELLAGTDGLEIEKRGRTVELKTEGAVLVESEMNLRERFQNSVSNPEIAFIFLMLGMMGLYFGLSMPGTFVPEVLGGVALIIGIYGMGLFDTNTTGIILMILGVGLIIAEVLTSGFGILGIGGAISLLVGSILLPLEPLMAPDWYHAFRVTVLGVVIGVSLLMLVVIQRVISARLRRKEQDTYFSVPKKAAVVEELAPSGLVSVQGELWKARNIEEGVIPVGGEVEVVNQEGLLLLVKPLYKSHENKPDNQNEENGLSNDLSNDISNELSKDDLTDDHSVNDDETNKNNKNEGG